MTAQHASAEFLTLNDSISYALRNNLSLKTYSNSVENSKLNVWTKEMEFSTSVRGSVSGELTGTNSKYTNITIEKPLQIGGSLSFGTNLNYQEFGDEKDYTSDSVIKFTYPLLKDRGPFYATYNLVSARRASESVIRGYEGLRQQIILDIISSYFRTVESLLLQEVYEKSLERTEMLLAASNAKLKAGLVTKMDVYRAEMQVIQAKNNLVNLTDSIESSKNNLKNLMAFPLDKDFLLDTKIEYIPGDFSGKDLLKLAFSSRPEIKNAEESIVDGERALKLANNNIWPRLDWWVGYGATGHGTSIGKSYDYNKPEFRTGFTLASSVTPWTGIAAIQIAEREIEDRKTNLQILKNNVTLEIKQYQSALKQYRSKIELSRINLDMAEKQLEFASLRFNKGFADNFSVKEAEEKFIEANVQFISALINARITEAKIKKACGELIYFE